MSWPMPNPGQWNPGITMTPDMTMGPYPGDQWAAMQQNWQQWAQWQQQYAQWQNQYGEKYAEQMQAMQPAMGMGVMPPLPPQSAPLPAPPPPSQPPPPPQENDQPLYAPVPPPGPPPPGPTRAGNSTTWPPAPEQPAAPAIASAIPTPAPPSSANTEALSKLAEEERLFDIQFQKWEEEIQKWKSENVNHPDKQAYNEYESKFEACRAQLLERRQQMNQKRARLLAGNSPAPSSNGNAGSTVPAKPAPPTNKNNFVNNAPVQNYKNNTSQNQNYSNQKNSSYQQYNSSGYNKKMSGSKVPQNRYDYNDGDDYSANMEDYSANQDEEDYTNQNIDDYSTEQDMEGYSVDQDTEDYSANQNNMEDYSVGDNYEDHTNKSSFLPTNNASKGIPGLDLVPNAEKPQQQQHDNVIDLSDEPQRVPLSRGPDYSSISKGINSILGDEKIMNILSMVQGQVKPGGNNRQNMNTQNMNTQPPNANSPNIPYGGPYSHNMPSGNQWDRNNSDYNQQYGNRPMPPNRQDQIYPQQNQNQNFSQNRPYYNQGQDSGSQDQYYEKGGQYGPPQREGPSMGRNVLPPPSHDGQARTGMLDNRGVMNPPPLMRDMHGNMNQGPPMRDMRGGMNQPLMRDMQGGNINQGPPMRDMQGGNMNQGPSMRDTLGPNMNQVPPMRDMQGANKNQGPPMRDIQGGNMNQGPPMKDMQGGSTNQPTPLMELVTQTPPPRSRPVWVEEPLFTPSIIVEYEHMPLRLKAREFIEPVHTFDYNHVSKDSDDDKRDFEKEADELFCRKSRRPEVDNVYGSDRFSREREPPKFAREYEYSGSDRFPRENPRQFERRPPRENKDDYRDDYRPRVPPRDEFDDRRWPDERFDDRRRDDRDNRNYRREDMYKDREWERERPNRERPDRERPDRERPDRERPDKERDRDSYRDRSREIKRDNNRNRSHERDTRKRDRSKETSVSSDVSSSKKAKEPEPAVKNPPQHVVMIDDILEPPGRDMRPEKIVIILRGPPGSGKSYLAKLIRDKEAEYGGTARIMSIDDYFMQEGEIEEKDPATGKIVKKPSLKYEYDSKLEESYLNSLKRAFKRSLTDGYFSFLIMDAPNEYLRGYADIWNYARQNGFQAYVCTMELDAQVCFKRNIHNRTLDEIQVVISRFFATPAHHIQLDPSTLLQSNAITEVHMEDAVDDVVMEDVEDTEVESVFTSKWERMDDAAQLARLDGTNKPLRPSQFSMADYLQLDDWKPNTARPGKKTVRWADIEERTQQEKMRAIGFVVGQTDWNRMTDPTMGSSALTQTKYIERVRRNY